MNKTNSACPVVAELSHNESDVACWIRLPLKVWSCFPFDYWASQQFLSTNEQFPSELIRGCPCRGLKSCIGRLGAEKEEAVGVLGREALIDARLSFCGRFTWSGSEAIEWLRTRRATAFTMRYRFMAGWITTRATISALNCIQFRIRASTTPSFIYELTCPSTLVLEFHSGTTKMCSEKCFRTRGLAPAKWASPWAE